jgi:hypothetical protein
MQRVALRAVRFVVSARASRLLSSVAFSRAVALTQPRAARQGGISRVYAGLQQGT